MVSTLLAAVTAARKMEAILTQQPEAKVGT